jgi:hypothetical protein
MKKLLFIVVLLCAITPVFARGKIVPAKDVLMAKFVISPTVTDPTEKMKYLYRARKILIDRLNELIGTSEYKDFHDNKFLPALAEIHAEMEKLKATSSVGVSPDVDLNDPKNRTAIDAYVIEKGVLSLSDLYDVDIIRDNDDLKPRE